MHDKIDILKKELSNELHNILCYWLNYTLDLKNGGFLGTIDYNDNAIPQSEKGAVLNARILWTFSAVYSLIEDADIKNTAKRAFNFITDYFYDKQNGGVFWSINANGTPKDTKKQIYALAFTIYGLSEYYQISKDEKALEMAISLYRSIEKYSYDTINKGYLEAFTEDWKVIHDLRLSEKDANEKKTMNTHLHIIEGYANLYKVWKDPELKSRIKELLEVIETYFINTKTGHLKLFFDEKWNENPDVISYGHDIEASWLLLQCAEVTEDHDLIERYKTYAIQMADATVEGIDADGGLWYEFDPKTNHLITEKHWWPQSELLIGFFNAWEITKNENYLETVIANWNFIKKHIIDQKKGEWFWGINADYSLMQKDKAGFWKCPYHNSRACLEIINRIKKSQYDKVFS